VLEDLAELRASLQAKREGDLERPGAILGRLGQATPSLDAVADALREMLREESALLEERKRVSSEGAHLTKLTIVFGSLLSLSMLAAAFLLILRESRRRAEAQTAAQRAVDELEDLYNNAPCGYHSVDAEGRFVRINDTWLAWLGYTREEVVGKLRHPDIMTAESAAYFRATAFPMFKRQGWLQDIEFEYRRKDGSSFHASLNATTIRDQDSNYLVSRSTVNDISERKRAEQAILDLNARLEESVERLKEVNEELESFSYSVSHDLRSPLRAIDGFSRMLEEDYGERLDDEGRRLLGVVRDGARKMAQLIEDLLAFSKFSRKALNPVRVDMQALAGGVAAELKAAAPHARLELGSLPEARGDPALLRQVWVNLLSNAFKYAGRREAPLVEVGSHSEAGELVYWVRDNGVGFDPRYVEKLFGVFQRLHGEAEFPGTGVGLAIVRRVVMRHGGRVWAEGALERGATFYFSLPDGGKGNG
jgi:PAS domain S-box-containing protein